MSANIVETRGHTTNDGLLHLDLNVGVADVDVTVTVRVVSVGGKSVDSKAWPEGYFEEVAGSMPNLERPPQGEFEDRSSLE